MAQHSLLLVSAFVMVIAGCSKSICRCLPPDADAGSRRDGVDAGPCAHLTPPRALATCGAPLTRTGEPIGRDSVTDGPATVAAVSVATDGSTELTVRQESGATRILQLPSDPGLTMDETIQLAVDGTGVAIFREGDFVAYEGGTVGAAEHREVLLRAADSGRTALVLGPVEAEVEALCVQQQGHHSPSFCPDVAMISFGLRFGETVVVPGDEIELTYDGWSLVVLNRNITQRDDRFAEDCEQCGDLWASSMDVAIVALPAP